MSSECTLLQLVCVGAQLNLQVPQRSRLLELLTRYSYVCQLCAPATHGFLTRSEYLCHMEEKLASHWFAIKPRRLSARLVLTFRDERQLTMCTCCAICSSMADVMSEHVRCHIDRTPYACSLCDAKYARPLLGVCVEQYMLLRHTMHVFITSYSA